MEHKTTPAKFGLIHARAEPDNMPGTGNTAVGHTIPSSRDRHEEAEEAALSTEKTEAVGWACREKWVSQGTQGWAL